MTVRDVWETNAVFRMVMTTIASVGVAGIIGGLGLLYVVDATATPEKYRQYQSPMQYMFDEILRRGTNSDGIIVRNLQDMAGPHDGVTTGDGWGYDYVGFLDYDLAPAPNALRYQDGTPNTCGIHGLHAALELILDLGVRNIAARVLGLARLLREGARARGVELACDAEGDEASGITSFRLEDAAVYATALEQRGVIVSAREGYLRVATHHFNNEADLERLLDAFH